MEDKELRFESLKLVLASKLSKNDKPASNLSDVFEVSNTVFEYVKNNNMPASEAEIKMLLVSALNAPKLDKDIYIKRLATALGIKLEVVQER